MRYKKLHRYKAVFETALRKISRLLQKQGFIFPLPMPPTDVTGVPSSHTHICLFLDVGWQKSKLKLMFFFNSISYFA